MRENKIKLEPSIYLSEEGNRLREHSPFKDGLVDEYNFSSLTDISAEGEDVIVRILKEKGWLIQFIKNPTFNMVMAAVEYNPFTLYYVKNVSLEMLECIIKVVKEDYIYGDMPKFVVYINNLSKEHIKMVTEKIFYHQYMNILEIDKEVLRDSVRTGHKGFSHLRSLIKQKDLLDPDFFKELMKIEVDVLSTGRRRGTIHMLKYYDKDSQCEELCLEVLKKFPSNHKYCKVKSKEVYLVCLKYAVTHAKSLMKDFEVSPDEVLAINGLALNLIDNPTHEQIVIALKQNGKAIQFVKNVNTEYSLLAVNQTGLALKYIKNPTDEIMIAAARETEKSLLLIEDKSKRAEIRAIVRERSFVMSNKLDKVLKDFNNNKLIINLVLSTIEEMVSVAIKNKSDVTDRDIIKACLDKRIGNGTLSKEELVNLIKNQINSVFI